MSVQPKDSKSFEEVMEQMKKDKIKRDIKIIRSK